MDRAWERESTCGIEATKATPQWDSLSSVRLKGLEPPRLAASDPKSDVATNYTTAAYRCELLREMDFTPQR